MKEESLKNLIDSADKILIVSHAGPDPDAISSTVFTLSILRKNFPHKVIRANIEGASLDQYKKLFNTDLVSNDSFKDTFNNFSPDLLIALDMAGLKLLSRTDIDSILSQVSKSHEIVMIDHHEELEHPYARTYINYFDNSCAESVYKVFIDGMKLKPYDNYANHLLLGIVGDTGSFGYLERNAESTFSITIKLLNEGGNIDEVRTLMNRLSFNELEVHREYLKNLTVVDDYSYSYISDLFFENHKEIPDAEYSAANKIFVQWYLKSVEDAFWGFTLKPLRKGEYTISFRSQIGMMDLTKLAIHLNGGGHKASAGGVVKANSDQEAVKIVQDIIEEYRKEAFAGE